LFRKRRLLREDQPGLAGFRQILGDRQTDSARSTRNQIDAAAPEALDFHRLIGPARPDRLWQLDWAILSLPTVHPPIGRDSVLRRLPIFGKKGEQHTFRQILD